MALAELEAASKFPTKSKKKVKERINYSVWSLKLTISETGPFWKHMTETARREKGVHSCQDNCGAMLHEISGCSPCLSIVFLASGTFKGRNNTYLLFLEGK